MAGESLSLSEVINWYEAFNNVISNYGGGLISSITPPSSGDTAKASTINTLYNTIDKFKSDEYLSTEPQLYSDEYAIVSSGTKIIRSTQAVPIEVTIDGIKQIKCRNKATYSNQYHSSGSKSCGTCGSGSHGKTCVYQMCSSGFNGKGTNNFQDMSKHACSSGKKSNGWKSNGYQTSGTKSCGTNTSGSHSCGICSSGTIIDLLNANVSTTK